MQRLPARVAVALAGVSTPPPCVARAPGLDQRVRLVPGLRLRMVNRYDRLVVYRDARADAVWCVAARVAPMTRGGASNISRT